MSCENLSHTQTHIPPFNHMEATVITHAHMHMHTCTHSLAASLASDRSGGGRHGDSTDNVVNE